MKTKRKNSLGACVDESVIEATEEWFRQHAGFRDREEAFANGLTSISAAVELWPGGSITVHVVLTARKKTQNLVAYEKYQRQPGEGYVKVFK